MQTSTDPSSSDGDRRWLDTPQQPVHGAPGSLPETRGYRLKRILLGPPLVNEDLQAERLGKPTALAVLSSDVMSSCAYGSESILRVLVPAAGVAAFTLVTPVTVLLLLVLGLVCLCYRQVVKAYPVSGGSYVVSRENLGFSVAQIPGAALLLSYVLTVAVSIAAGVDAVISAFPVLSPYPVELSIACVVLLMYGNLRGIREAGKVFAVPTYLFLASMAALMVAGFARLLVSGHLHQFALKAHGHVQVGHAGGGLLLGAGVFLFLRGFANGGSAMTGMEAISNAVPVFKDPAVRNARTTLFLMASILGAMFVSVSILAALSHAVPFTHGTPTVLSELGGTIFGPSGIGRFGYYFLQFSTALILILGANTSFNGFPLLVNFIAEDSYLPRPLRRRGHRLVYSNGIVALAGVSALLLAVTRAQVASLIPLYACTVFTGFTMAGLGMTKYHMTHSGPNHKRHLVVALSTFVASLLVTLIFVVTEFSRGAWLVVVCIPLIVFVLTRTNRRYNEERQVLAEDSESAQSDAPALRNHVVVVLVDKVDLATARAVQLARSLSTSGEIRAVHFVTDVAFARAMTDRWTELGRWRIPLELIECPDRRLARAATEMAAELAADGQTEVMIVLPRRLYRGLANRILHSNTADRIVAAMSAIPNVSATIAPFDVSGLLAVRGRHAAIEADTRAATEAAGRPAEAPRTGGSGTDGSGTGGSGTGAGQAAERADGERTSGRGKAGDRPAGTPGPPRLVPVGGTTPIGALVYRKRSRISGKVRSVKVQPWSGVQALECTLVDGSGAVNVVFLGRRAVPGITVGIQLVVEGMVNKHDGCLAVLNPLYEILLPVSEEESAEI
ncbi:MAG: amino acid permease [Acidimicrobiales bacterium]